jgi:PAS domain S-box-containing protein
MTATILVVDDSEDDRRLYQRALKDIDCRLVMASSAQAGIACTADPRPDVILLDYNLPDMDGLSFIRLLAGYSGTPPPIIMLTGEGSESVAVEVMKSGADDYLVKDTAGQYLRLLPGVIGRVIASHTQREQNRRLMQETARLLRRYQALMKNSADGIHVMDARGNIVEANDAFCRMLGYTQEEVTRLKLADWDGQWSIEDLRARFRNFIGKSAVFETVHRRKDGTLINVELSTSHVEMEGQDLFFALSRDITERKQAEAVLRQHKLVLDTSIDGFWMTDVTGNLLEANGAYAKMSGYSIEELLTMHISQLDAIDRVPEEVHAHIAKIIAQGHDRFETRHRRKDRHEIEIEISVTYMAEPQRLFVFCRDITERKRAEKALLKADQRKDEFLAMLAHELRNPLAPIRNAAHVLGRLELAEPKVHWARKIIEEQVAHLSRMVDDLLDVSRIARGKIVLKKETVELAALFGQVSESARLLAERKGHRLTVRLPERPVQLEGDPVRLSQVLVNLLDNAIKYTPEGGHIELAARVAGQGIEISVRDNGMGISASLLPHVFDLFQQDERTLDRAQGGLGIGLTLVQRLVERHGGRVKARSDGPGLGSTFTLWLPTKSISATPAVSEVQGNVSMRLLVVDDNHDVADSMAAVLELEGHEACAVYDGQAALELIPSFRPQVVLLDIGLRGMNGFDTVKRLRELPEGRDLCVVAMTGYGDEKTRSRALASGCDHFLVKPVAYDVLDALLVRIAGGTVLIE